MNHDTHSVKALEAQNAIEMANPSNWRDRRRSPLSGGSWSDDDPPNEGRQERPEASSLLHHRSALDIQGEHRRPYSPVAETVSSGSTQSSGNQNKSKMLFSYQNMIVQSNVVFNHITLPFFLLSA